MLKSFVRAVILLSIGAGIGIWYAPPTAKKLMKEKLGFAQSKAKDFQTKVASGWFSTAEEKLKSAPKVDLSKLNKRQFDSWLQSVQKAYASVSEQAIQTQKSVNAVHQYLEDARTQYKKQHDRFFGI